MQVSYPLQRIHVAADWGTIRWGRGAPSVSTTHPRAHPFLSDTRKVHPPRAAGVAAGAIGVAEDSVRALIFFRLDVEVTANRGAGPRAPPRPRKAYCGLCARAIAAAGAQGGGHKLIPPRPTCPERWRRWRPHGGALHVGSADVSPHFVCGARVLRVCAPMWAVAAARAVGAARRALGGCGRCSTLVGARRGRACVTCV